MQLAQSLAWAPIVVSGGLFIGMLLLSLDLANVQLGLHGRSRVVGNIVGILIALFIALFVFAVFVL